MPTNLNSLPADLLNRLDQVLPLFTEAAIRGEFWSGLVSFALGLIICGLFSLFLWAIVHRPKRTETDIGLAFVYILGLLIGVGVALAHLPSVFAPDAVLARELLVGLRK